MLTLPLIRYSRRQRLAQIGVFLFAGVATGLVGFQGMPDLSQAADYRILLMYGVPFALVGFLFAAHPMNFCCLVDHPEQANNAWLKMWWWQFFCFLLNVGLAGCLGATKSLWFLLPLVFVASSFVGLTVCDRAPWQRALTATGDTPLALVPPLPAPAVIATRASGSTNSLTQPLLSAPESSANTLTKR